MNYKLSLLVGIYNPELHFGIYNKSYGVMAFFSTFIYQFITNVILRRGFGSRNFAPMNLMNKSEMKRQLRILEDAKLLLGLFTNIRMTFSHIGMTFSSVGVTFSRIRMTFSRVGVTFSHVGMTFSRVRVTFSRVRMTFSHVGMTFSRVIVTFSRAIINLIIALIAIPSLKFSKI